MKKGESYLYFDDRNFCDRICYLEFMKENKKKKWMPLLKKIYKEHIYDEYTIQHLSKKYKVSRPYLMELFKEFGYEVRGIKDASILRSKLMTQEQKMKLTEKARKARYKGATHKNFRTRVFKFFPNICSMCGETDKEKLIAHHIIPQKYDGRKSTGEGDHRVRNGIIVCTKCHSKIHE